jgi:hypothetical protein
VKKQKEKQQKPQLQGALKSPKCVKIPGTNHQTQITMNLFLFLFLFLFYFIFCDRWPACTPPPVACVELASTKNSLNWPRKQPTVPDLANHTARNVPSYFTPRATFPTLSFALLFLVSQ